MSFSAEHYFWQQRVDKEIHARNKYPQNPINTFRFIENVFLKTATDFSGSKQNVNNSFHLYEVGSSDPNQIRPREFKHPYQNVPVELNKCTYDKLAELTQGYVNTNDKRRPVQTRNEYVGYVHAGKSDNRALSHTGSSRKSFAQAAANNLQTIERTYDGKKKRKRFNEEAEETLSRGGGKSVVSKRSNTLTQHHLKQFNHQVKGDGMPSQISQDYPSHNNKSIRVTMKSHVSRVSKPEGKSDINYKSKIMNLVSALDEKQLEELGRELENQCDEQLQEDLQEAPKPSEENPEFDEIRSQAKLQADQMSSISELKSVAVSDMKSRKSTTFTMINKLERQLNDEKYQREKLQLEIEELKKMNTHLCSAILQNQTPTFKPK